MAITFLRDGIVSSTKEISWRHLPDASGEIQVLNAAIQTDKIDVIELLLNGPLRRLSRRTKRVPNCVFARSRLLTALEWSLKFLIQKLANAALGLLICFSGQKRSARYARVGIGVANISKPTSYAF